MRFPRISLPPPTLTDVGQLLMKKSESSPKIWAWANLTPCGVPQIFGFMFLYIYLYIHIYQAMCPCDFTYMHTQKDSFILFIRLHIYTCHHFGYPKMTAPAPAFFKGSDRLPGHLWRRIGFTQRPCHATLLQRTQLEVGGTLLAARAALEHGMAGRFSGKRRGFFGVGEMRWKFLYGNLWNCQHGILEIVFVLNLPSSSGLKMALFTEMYINLLINFQVKP